MLAFVLVCHLALQSGGVQPEWEIRQKVEKLTAEVESLKPVLDQMDPARWTDQTAAGQYSSQYQSVRNGSGQVQEAVKKFSAQPEKLSVALDLLFRLDSLTASAGLLGQGVRRYQNPAIADLLEASVRQTSNTREVLRQHVQDLAELREKELEVADKEAQRCRAQLAKPSSGRK